jgi:enterochelin esterase-like enzyme
MKAVRLWCFVLAGVCWLLLAECRQREPVIMDHPRAFAGLRMEDVTFRSAALARDMAYRVYLPVEATPGRKLSVIYLLHGGGGGFKDWSNYSDVSRCLRKSGMR